MYEVCGRGGAQGIEKRIDRFAQASQASQVQEEQPLLLAAQIMEIAASNLLQLSPP